MNISQKLDKWAKKLESLQSALELIQPAPLIQEETIAVNYPSAWGNLQKRLYLLKWSLVVTVVVLVLLATLRLQELLPAPLDAFTQSKIRGILIWPGFIALLVAYCASIFRCPRCKHLFLFPGVRTVDGILEDPESRCQHCDLKIGRPM